MDQEQELYYQYCLSKAEEEAKGQTVYTLGPSLKPGDKIWVQATVQDFDEWAPACSPLCITIDPTWSGIFIEGSTIVRRFNSE